MYTNQKQIRQAFWQYLKLINPELYKQGKRSKRQNEQKTDVRLTFIDFVDHLYNDGDISEAMRKKVTL
jgi:hypothetical protein